MTLATNIVLGVAAGVLLVSALVAVNRVAAGPSQLDRSVAADLIVAVVIAALGLWTVWTDQPTELLVLVLLSLLGFTWAVSVGRLVRVRMAMRKRFSARH